MNITEGNEGNAMKKDLMPRAKKNIEHGQLDTTCR